MNISASENSFGLGPQLPDSRRVANGDPKTGKGAGGSHFEDQLAVQTGKEVAEQSKAKRFNENGFFRSVPNNQGDNSAADGSANQSATKSRSNDIVTKEAAPNLTDDIADAFKSKDVESLRAYLVDILGTPRANTDGKTHIVHGKTPLAKVEFAEDAPMRTSNGDGRQYLDMEVSTSGRMQTNEANRSAPEAQTKASNAEIVAQKAAMAERILKEQIAKARTPIKLAITELDNGVKLVAEVGNLKKEAREQLQLELRSLLALHGLGNYDLHLNSEHFSGRILAQDDFR